jgi:hypothetical protein
MRLEKVYSEFENALHVDMVEPFNILGGISDVPADYVSSVKEGDPIAHIISAHLVIPIATSKSWFHAGMPVKVLYIIKCTLDEKWHKWLRWPKEQLGTNLEAFRKRGLIGTEMEMSRTMSDLTNERESET